MIDSPLFKSYHNRICNIYNTKSIHCIKFNDLSWNTMRNVKMNIFLLPEIIKKSFTSLENYSYCTLTIFWQKYNAIFRDNGIYHFPQSLRLNRQSPLESKEWHGLHISGNISSGLTKLVSFGLSIPGIGIIGNCSL